MTKENDILRKVVATEVRNVPDHYFDELRERLQAIPSTHRSCVAPSLWRRPGAYLALAACLVAAVVVGDLSIRGSAGSPSGELEFSEYLYSDLVLSSAASVDYLLTETEDLQLSDEDIIDFLLESGATENHLVSIGSFDGLGPDLP